MNRSSASASGAVLVETVRCATDARGALFEPLEERAIAAQRNVHLVLSVPGAIRGNHRHRRATETTVVYGPARVRWRTAQSIETVEIPAGEAWRFVFPPGVPHAYENTGSGTMVLASFSTEPHDAAAPDTEREVLLP